jgi:hypothetical protein
VQQSNVKINNNHIDTTSDTTIYINNTSAKNSISIQNNTIKNSTAFGGVLMNFSDNSKVSGNIFKGITTNDIELNNCTNAEVAHNTIVDGQNGITIGSTNSGVLLSENMVTGCSINGMVLSAACQLGDNYVTGNTTNWSGTFIISPNTQTGATYTVTRNDTSIIANRAGTITLTLEAAAGVIGKNLLVRTIQAQTVVSATSNVVPRAGGAAGTAILAATAGNWAILQSDGTNYQIMAGS